MTVPLLTDADCAGWGTIYGAVPIFDRLARIEQAIGALVRRSDIRLHCGEVGCPRQLGEELPALRGADCPQYGDCMVEVRALLGLGVRGEAHG